MTKRFWIGLVLLLVIPGLIFTVSCAKKEVVSEPVVTPTVDEDAEARRLAEEARARALEEQRLREQRLQEEQLKGAAERAERDRFQNEDIHFEFDKSNLLPEAQDILRDKAQYMMANPDISVIIEGHCDERGTNEYNMALGDRRAGSAKGFLVDLGIASQRLTTISYGEEKPLDPGHDEGAWAKNRRAHFVIEQTPDSIIIGVPINPVEAGLMGMPRFTLSSKGGKLDPFQVAGAGSLIFQPCMLRVIRRL